MQQLAVVVAHPDDEALWFGGSLMRLAEGGASMTVVALTNANNEIRAREFEAYCASLGAMPAMLDYPDGGHAQLPAFPWELSPLLRERGVDPAELDCVITHSPLGNERAHPQHVQCWKAVAAWARAEHVPIGFFSESAPLQLSRGRPQTIGNGVILFRTRVEVWGAVRATAASLRRRPLDVRSHRRPWLTVFRNWRRFRGVRSGIEVVVDPAAKAELIESAYAAQLLHAYAAYHQDREFVYLMDSATAKALARGLACLSN